MQKSSTTGPTSAPSSKLFPKERTRRSMSTTTITIPTNSSLHHRLNRYFSTSFINYFANRFSGWDRLSVRGFVTDIVILTILLTTTSQSDAGMVSDLKRTGSLLINNIVDDPDLKSQSLRFLEKWISEP